MHKRYRLSRRMQTVRRINAHTWVQRQRGGGGGNMIECMCTHVNTEKRSNEVCVSIYVCLLSITWWGEKYRFFPAFPRASFCPSHTHTDFAAKRKYLLFISELWLAKHRINLKRIRLGWKARVNVAARSLRLKMWIILYNSQFILLVQLCANHCPLFIPFCPPPPL